MKLWYVLMLSVGVLLLGVGGTLLLVQPYAEPVSENTQSEPEYLSSDEVTERIWYYLPQNVGGLTKLTFDRNTLQATHIGDGIWAFRMSRTYTVTNQVKERSPIPAPGFSYSSVNKDWYRYVTEESEYTQIVSGKYNQFTHDIRLIEYPSSSNPRPKSNIEFYIGGERID